MVVLGCFNDDLQKQCISLHFKCFKIFVESCNMHENYNTRLTRSCQTSHLSRHSNDKSGQVHDIYKL